MFSWCMYCGLLNFAGQSQFVTQHLHFSFLILAVDDIRNRNQIKSVDSENFPPVFQETTAFSLF